MTAELDQKFLEILNDYEKKFGERIFYPEGLQTPLEDWIRQVRRCIETNTPYEPPDLPEGCIS